MTLQESGESSGKISLAGLFRGEFQPVQVQQDLSPLATILCRGGWPSVISKKQASSERLMESYFDALFEVNIPRRGLRGSESRKVARSLARNLGAAVKLSTVAADAAFNDIEPKSAAAKAASHIDAATVV